MREMREMRTALPFLFSILVFPPIFLLIVQLSNFSFPSLFSFSRVSHIFHMILCNLAENRKHLANYRNIVVGIGSTRMEFINMLLQVVYMYVSWVYIHAQQ